MKNDIVVNMIYLYERASASYKVSGRGAPLVSGSNKVMAAATRLAAVKTETGINGHRSDRMKTNGQTIPPSLDAIEQIPIITPLKHQQKIVFLELIFILLFFVVWSLKSGLILLYEMGLKQ